MVLAITAAALVLGCLLFSIAPSQGWLASANMEMASLTPEQLWRGKIRSNPVQFLPTILA